MLRILILLAPATAGAPPVSDVTKNVEEPPALAFRFGDVWLTPLLGPGYSPELGFTVGGGGTVSWKTDEDSPRSNVIATVTYGTIGAITSYIKLSSYSRHNRLQVDADLGIRDLTDHYFGVGYNLGSTTPEGDETTKYQRGWFQIKPAARVLVARNLYVGGLLDVNGTNATELNPRMAADPTIVAEGTRFMNAGLGPVVVYDSRDVPQNAYTGFYLQGRLNGYLSVDGDAHAYGIFDLDARRYLQLGRIGRILAWNLHTRAGIGDVPWPELPSMGSSSDLRGYRGGQYRDNTFIYALVEYRHGFMRDGTAEGGPKLSTHGFVLWGGVGFMGPDFWSLSPPLPALGVGYRFAVQGRMNARIDYGTGKFESNAVYLNFGEVF